MRKKLQTQFSTRQHMIKDEFEIYYYSDANFTGVSSHTHDYFEFYFFLEGDVSMQINDTAVLLKPGDMLLIPPGTPHHATGLKQEKPYRRFVFWITESFFERLSTISADYVYIIKEALEHRRYLFHYDIITFNSIQGIIFRLIEELHSDRFGKESMLQLRVNDLILQINRTVYEADHPSSPQAEHHLYENLIQYIETHLDEELSLDLLARIFYVSKYHIAHVFKKHLGLSVHQYITKKRLTMCRDAILGNTSISEACLIYGFRDYSSFFRAFRKEYGLSPKEYKELYSFAQEG